MIDAASQKVFIGFLTAFGALRSFAVQNQLDRIQNGRLSATVHAPKQDDWL